MIVGSSLIFVLLMNIQRVVSYKVVLRMVEKVERSIERAPDTKRNASHICNIINKSEPMLACRQARDRFTDKYDLDVEMDVTAEMEAAKPCKTTNKGLFFFGKQEKIISACKCPLDWPIFLVNEIESTGVVIAIVKQPQLGKKSWIEGK